MENEISKFHIQDDKVLIYTFLGLIVIFSTAILHASKKGVRISKYLKILDL